MGTTILVTRGILSAALLIPLLPLIAFGETTPGLALTNQDQTSRASSLRAEAEALSKTAESEVGVNQKEYFRQAIAKFEEASRIYHNDGDEAEELFCLAMIGHASRVIGEIPQAIRFLNQALGLTNRPNLQRLQPLILSELGFAYDEGGYEKEALDHYRRAVLENVESWKGQSSYLQAITSRFVDLLATVSDSGVYVDAIAVQKKIISLAHAFSSTDKEFAKVEMFALSGLGKNYAELGMFDQAIASYKDGLEINKQFKDPFIQQNLSNNIGVAYLRLGSLTEAKQYVEEALRLANANNTVLEAEREKGEEWKRRWQYNLDLTTRWKANMGAVYTRLKRYDLATLYFDETLPQLRTMRSRQLTEKATLDVRNSTAFIVVSSYYYGQVLREQHKTDSAIALHREARTFAHESNLPKFESRSLIELGLDYLAINNASDALKEFEQALFLARITQVKDEEIASLDGLMRAYELLKEPRLAIFFGKQSVNLLQSARTEIQSLGKEVGADFIRANDTTYRRLSGILISDGRLNEALQVANLARDQEFFDGNFSAGDSGQAKQIAGDIDFTPRESTGKSLLEKPLKQNGANSPSPASATMGAPDEDSRLKAVSAEQINDLKLRLQKIKALFTASASEEDRVKSRVELSRLSDDECRRSRQEYLSGSVADAEELKCTLFKLEKKSKSKRFAAVYTLSLEDKFYALLVTPAGLKAFSNPTDAVAVRQKVDALLSVLRCPKFDPKERSSELYRLIFKSTSTDGSDTTLESELEKQRITVLLWSLDGPLRYVPVASLYDKAAGQYVVQRYESAVFTRAKSERFLRQPKPWMGGIGFGISKPVTLLGQIQGVKEALSSVFDNGKKQQGRRLRGRVILDANFTVAALTRLRGRWPLVLIMSHFEYVPGNSRMSTLLLGNHVRWSLSEMQKQSGLFAEVELLTLSACETAVQQPNADGKEIDGFAELAQRLGARSVIATQWSIYDQATSRFIVDFFRQHRDHPDWSKSELMRQTQLDLLTGKVSIKSDDLSGTYIKSCTVNDATPFAANPQAPLAHPFYWSPFVLYGGPN